MAETPLRRHFGAPIHHQLYAMLRNDIVSGRYASGETLPGEEALRELFDVSRTTVRRALLSLEQEGLIDRRQGRGTRVAPRVVDAAVPTIQNYLAGIERLDRTSVLRIHQYDYVRPPTPARESLGLGSDAQVLKIVRVRVQGDQPLWHLTNFLPESVARRIDRSVLEATNLYEALRVAGSPCRYADDLLGATLAHPAVAMLLNINVGAALLESYRVMFDVHDSPISVQVTLIPPEQRRLRLRMFADDKAVLPAAGAPGLLTASEFDVECEGQGGKNVVSYGGSAR